MDFVDEDTVQARLNLNLNEDVGADGMNSDVFRASDVQLQRDVAVKAMPKRRFKGELKEYHEEARRLYMTRHPNIAEVLYGCISGNKILVVMPFYSNGSMSDVLNNQRLTMRKVVRYGLDVLVGLNRVHTKGLVHLDIKPSNILIDDADRAVLTDFGQASELDDTGFAPATPVYPWHITPDHLRQSGLTVQTDIYQAGLTLYRMVNGEKWFKRQLQQIWGDGERQALHEAVETGTFPDRHSFVPHVPKDIRYSISKALNPNPDKRWKSTLRFMNKLGEADRNLDWKWDGEVEKTMHFVSPTDKRERTITVSGDGRDWSVETSDLVYKSGNTLKRSIGCGKNMELEDALDFVQSFIKSEPVMYNGQIDKA